MNLSALRHIGRIREVLGVLGRRGYGHVVTRLPIPFKIAFPRKQTSATPLPEETRRALEELGPTAVKLGQLLSTRRDLIPPEFARELQVLQEGASPFSYEEVCKIVQEDLGAGIEELFEDFDPTPLGAASIAQVHSAVYGGCEVVVKVRRPGIAHVIAEDVEIMEAVARLIHDYIPEMRIYDLPGLSREFGRALKSELNFRREADALDLFGRGFADQDRVRIPRVFREASRDRVITMERLRGERVSDVASLPADRRRSLARAALEMSFRQFFRLGFFHADPHPGNVMVMEGDVLGLMDFGRIGVVDDRMELRLAELMSGILDRDYSLITDVVLDIARPIARPDRLRLLRDLTELVEFNYQKSVDQISIGDILTSLLDLMQRHRLVFAGEYVMLVGAVITAESTANMIYPELNPVDEMAPHVKRALRSRFSPPELARRAKRTGRRLLRDVEDVSQNLVSLVSQAESGDFTLRFRHVGLEGLITGLERISKRLIAGVITASLIIAGSLIVGLDQPPFMFGYPFLGVASFTIAAILGLWLLMTRR